MAPRRPNRPRPTATTSGAADRALFSRAMRDVRPLRGGAPVTPVPEGAEFPTPRALVADDGAGLPPLPLPLPSPLSPPISSGASGRAAPHSSIDAGLDKRTAQRLKRGKLPIEARLDLHGHTQIQAHRALHGFLDTAVAAGMRCVLVVTGKGSALRRAEAESPWTVSSGVLREAVPRWLEEPANRARIIAFYPAQARDGGGGALYLLLRRQRAKGAAETGS